MSAGINCVYNTGSKHETHAQALKRKLSEVSDRESAFQRLFCHLRERPESEAVDIVKRIRAGADPESILRRIQEGDLLLQLALVPETRYRYVFPLMRDMPETLLRPDNPYLASCVYEWASAAASTSCHHPPPAPGLPAHAPAPEPQSPYLKPYHAAEVVDALIGNVSPSEWTTVSSEDALMRKLLSLFFRNQYQWFPSFQKDYFLQDMAARRRSFCSPLLVNAVFAIASVSATAPPRCTVPSSLLLRPAAV